MLGVSVLLAASSCRGILGVEDANLVQKPGDDAAVPSEAGADQDSSLPDDALVDQSSEQDATVDPPPGQDATQEQDALPPLQTMTCAWVLPSHTKLYEAQGFSTFIEAFYADAVPSMNQMRVFFESPSPSSTDHPVFTVGLQSSLDTQGSVSIGQFPYLHGAITRSSPPTSMTAVMSMNGSYGLDFFLVDVPGGFPSDPEDKGEPVHKGGSPTVTSLQVVEAGATVKFAASFTDNSLHYATFGSDLILTEGDAPEQVLVTAMVRLGTDNYVFLRGKTLGPVEYVVNDLDSSAPAAHTFAKAGVELLAAGPSTTGGLNIALRDAGADTLYLGQLSALAARTFNTSQLKAVTLSSLPAFSTKSVEWIGDELVMVGPTDPPTSVSILWLDPAGRIRVQGSVGAGSGGPFWKVLTRKQSLTSTTADLHLAWTERSEPEGGPLHDIGWYNQIHCQP